MNNVSIVIIAKDEEHIISQTLRQALKITDDVILADTGSTDATVSIAEYLGVRVIKTDWLGYGQTKNKAVSFTKYPWVLSLDADEVADDTLVQFMQNFIPDRSFYYKVKRNTFFAKKLIRNPILSPMYRYRLYHKCDHQWDNSLVHEKLTNPKLKKTARLNGCILHFSYRDELHQIDKCDLYARKQAEEWFNCNITPSFFKRNFSAYFRFLKHYILHFGFMYGKEGFIHAKNEFILVKKQLKYFKNIQNQL